MPYDDFHSRVIKVPVRRCAVPARMPSQKTLLELTTRCLIFRTFNDPVGSGRVGSQGHRLLSRVRPSSFSVSNRGSDTEQIRPDPTKSIDPASR